MTALPLDYGLRMASGAQASTSFSSIQPSLTQSDDARQVAARQEQTQVDDPFRIPKFFLAGGEVLQQQTLSWVAIVI